MPAKETYFTLIKVKHVSDRQNRHISILLVGVTYLLSVALPNIKSAIALTGATVNPFIGFLFPLLFYLKLTPKISLLSTLLALSMFAFFSLTSLLAIYLYFA